MTIDPKRTSRSRYIRVDDKLWEAMKQYAKRGRRPVTMQLELIIEEWLRGQKREENQIRFEVLPIADSGNWGIWDYKKNWWAKSGTDREFIYAKPSAAQNKAERLAMQKENEK